MLEKPLLNTNITCINIWLIIFLVSSNMVIYLRGSLGFGEEALQSLPGKVGQQVLIMYLVLLHLLWSFFSS